MMRSNTKIQINSANSDLILQAHLEFEIRNSKLELSFVIWEQAAWNPFTSRDKQVSEWASKWSSLDPKMAALEARQLHAAVG